MRLIDADALYEKAYWHGKLPDVGNPYADGVEAVDMNDIEEAPTIDPESIRQKGEWTVIDGEDWNEDVIYQCPICKEEFVTIDGTPAENLWNYCPKCGAKMSEG